MKTAPPETGYLRSCSSVNTERRYNGADAAVTPVKINRDVQTAAGKRKTEADAKSAPTAVAVCPVPQAAQSARAAIAKDIQTPCVRAPIQTGAPKAEPAADARQIDAWIPAAVATPRDSETQAAMTE